MRIYHYFDKYENLVPVNCHIKIGTREVDDNDNDLTIPNHYTNDSYELSVRRPKFIKYDLKINNEIQDEIVKKFQFIAINTPLSRKMRSVLRLLYNTLSLNDKESLIITYSTIFETLLLESREDLQRKKVSIRAACLLANGREKDAKRFLASWIYYFYSYRNKIVHGGMAASELHREEGIIFDHTINIIHNVIVDLIEVFVEEKYNLNDINNIVKKNKKKDKIKDIYTKNKGYISDKRIMYYEDEYDDEVSLKEFMKRHEPELERKIKEKIKDKVALTN
nr:HEPN domain-containing protein [Clostridium perfringens]